MGMNNVYYRSLHLMQNPEYRTLPARLRMNVIANPGRRQDRLRAVVHGGLGDQRLRHVPGRPRGRAAQARRPQRPGSRPRCASPRWSTPSAACWPAKRRRRASLACRAVPRSSRRPLTRAPRHAEELRQARLEARTPLQAARTAAGRPRRPRPGRCCAPGSPVVRKRRSPPVARLVFRVARQIALQGVGDRLRLVDQRRARRQGLAEQVGDDLVVGAARGSPGRAAAPIRLVSAATWPSITALSSSRAGAALDQSGPGSGRARRRPPRPGGACRSRSHRRG